jgi:hypothetical protein
MSERVICRVSENKSNGQLLIYVPKKSKLISGDYVELISIPKVSNLAN